MANDAIADLLSEEPAHTVANAEKILLPDAAKKFAEWKTDLEKRGKVFSPNATISFDPNLSSLGVVYTSNFDDLVADVTLPETSRRSTILKVFASMFVAEVFYVGEGSGRKLYNGSAPLLNNISALTIKAGIPMPLIYTTEDNSKHATASALPSIIGGTGNISIQSRLINDPNILGVVGHELGHLAASPDDIRKRVQMIADILNDPTGEVQRRQETAADIYAVKLGVGAELRDYLLNQPSSIERDNSSHPSNAQRVEAINYALCDMKLPQCSIEDADDGAKSPTPVSSSPPTQTDSLKR